MSVLTNPKHEKFAEELAKGKPADEAYAIAGYRPDRGHASRLAANGNIRARVEEILGQSAERCGVTVDRITAELAKIGFADIRKAVRWGEGTVVTDHETGEARVVHDVALLSSDQIDDQTAVAISEVRKTRDGISIKFYDKQAALVNLGRNLGMFKDKVEMTGKDGESLAGPTVNVYIPANNRD
jgi:phage terminase small subunit